jgi:predicted ATPase
MDRFVVISGCSGGGKSTLLAELNRRGYAVIEEPGRRIVEAELSSGGSALPWIDGVAFARRALATARDDFVRAAGAEGWVFFDRGLIDAAINLQHLTDEPARAALGSALSYNHQVFLAPPWSEIYSTDRERRHDFATAEAEYVLLREAYPALGYEVAILPKVTVEARADFVLARLARQDP